VVVVVVVDYLHDFRSLVLATGSKSPSAQGLFSFLLEG
jgi:hypothetical protein